MFPILRGTLFLSFLTLVAALFAAAAATGSINGTAVSPEGEPVSSAWISAVRIDVSEPFFQHALSAPDGTFNLINLPAGKYRLCFQLPTSEYLNPCVWSARQADMTLADGQELTGQQIQVARGAFLRVRINDPNKRLKAAKEKVGAGKEPPPLLGVWAPNGLFLPLDMAAEDENGKNFQLLVPLNTPLRLSIGGGAVQLENEARTALPAQGTAIEVQRTSADAHHKTLIFTVR